MGFQGHRSGVALEFDGATLRDGVRFYFENKVLQSDRLLKESSLQELARLKPRYPLLLVEARVCTQRRI